MVGWKGGTKLTSFLNLMIFLRNCIVPCAIINFQTQEFSFTIDMALGYKLSTHISYHRFQIWLPIKTYLYRIWILSTIVLRIKACIQPYSKNSSSIFFAIASFVINVTCDMCNCHVSKGHTIISSIRHKISKSLILMMEYRSENPTLIQFLQKKATNHEINTVINFNLEKFLWW